MKIALFLAVTALGWAQDAPKKYSVQPMPELPQMLSYKLTPGALDKYIQASRNVNALLAKDPAYRQRMRPDSKEAPRTIDASVAYAKANLPELYQAVERAGISFREYTLFQGSLVLAWVASKRAHPGTRIEVLPENLKFIQEHHEKVAEILQEQSVRGKM